YQEQLLLTAESTLKKMHDEHIQFLEEEQKQLFIDYEETLSKEEWQNREEIIEDYEKLKLQTELFSFENWNDTLKEKRKDLLDNAAIIPADFRDKLRLFLESQQPGFKVGGLFTAKKKTEEEISRRKEELYDQYLSIVSSQIIGHLKGLMKQSLRDVGALTEQTASKIDHITFEIPFSVIEDQIHKGSLVTGDAVLNFANRVAEATKRFFIQET
ncbi:GTPase, partial [Butyricicoccus sp. 1XD8-22]